MRISRRTFLAGAVSGLVLGAAGPARALCKSEARGCYTLQVVPIVYNPRNRMLDDVYHRRRQIYDVAYDVHQHVLASDGRRDNPRADDIRRYNGDVDVYVYAHRTTRQGLGQVAIYDNTLHPTKRRQRLAVSLEPQNWPPVPQTPIGRPDYVYSLHSKSGNTAMIAWPDGYFRNEEDPNTGTYIFVCAPHVPSIVPSAAQQNGIWLTPGTLPYYRRVGTWSTTFIMMPGEMA